MFDEGRDEIAKLEADLEELAGVAERCRKISVGAKVAIAAGGLLLVLMFVGVFTMSGTPLLTSLILLLGGTVLLGSNSSTAQQTAEKIANKEKLRAELISGIDLRLVEDAPKLLH